MAIIEREAGVLRVALTDWERLGALHGSIEVPESAVVSVERVEDLWEELRGFRAPGTGFPGVIMLGTTRYDGVKDFNAVYGHRPGTVVTLEGCEFARVLVSDGEPPVEK